jgi:predicted outer membrane repeat protein
MTKALLYFSLFCLSLIIFACSEENGDSQSLGNDFRRLGPPSPVPTGPNFPDEFVAEPPCRTSIEVTKTNDETGTCFPDNCALREAIIFANRCQGNNIIYLPSGVYQLTIPDPSPGVGGPAFDIQSPLVGDLDVTDGITIYGDSRDNTFIDGNQLDRVMEIHGGSSKIARLTIRNGKTIGTNVFDTAGGGIRINKDAKVIIVDSIIRDNKADFTASGGGVFNQGDLNIQDTKFIGNEATRRGGGLENWGTGQVYIQNTEFRNNKAYRDGGGAYISVLEGTPRSFTCNQCDFINNTGRYNNTVEGAFTGGLALRAVDMTINNSSFRFNTGSALGASAGSNVLIHRSTFQQNISEEAGGRGGAIHGSVSRLEITESEFLDNSAAKGGGAIATSGTLKIESCDFRNNHTEHVGGGIILIDGVADIISSTFRNNRGSQGGAMFIQGQANIYNSTFSHNDADETGGAIMVGVFGNLYTKNVTIAYNRSLHPEYAGGGISLSPFSGLVNLSHTIVANNTPTDCLCPLFTPDSLGYNLAGDETCELAGTGDMNSTDPMLGPLGDNGGLTYTLVPQPDSPAIDGGSNVTTPFITEEGCLPRDQRDESRIQGSACDIGAVETVPSGLTKRPKDPKR